MLRLINYFDLFGTQILFRFREKQYYKTSFGSSLTLALSVIILIRFSIIFSDVSQRRDPFVIFKERSVLSPEIQKMSNSTIHFTFGMQDPIQFKNYIDPSIYTIKMRQFTKKTFFNETTKKLESKWTNRDIKIGQCKEENFQNKVTREYFLSLNYQNMYCIDPQEIVEIEGDFNSNTFSYYTIRVMKCLGANCSPKPQTDALLKKGFFSMFFSDITVDPVQSENPFQYFSRDIYWMTSSELPSDVMIYYRNNYIETDNGWINSDVSVQSHAQFSNTQNQYLPPSFDQYYFQITVRFEKQKENLYQRKYKSLTQIISEIGGFAQVLFAAGFLLCTRLSSLDLSKTIINDAFNFQISSLEKTQNPENKSEAIQKNLQNKLSTLNYKNSQQNRILKDEGEAENNQITKSFPKQTPFKTSNGDKKSQENYQNSKMSDKNQMNHLDEDQFSPSKLRVKDISLFLQKEDSNKFPSLNKHISNSKQNTTKCPSFNSQILLSSIIQKKKIVQQEQGNKDLSTTSPSKKGKSLNPKQEITEDKFKKLLQSTTNNMKLSTWEYIKYFFWPFGEEIKKKKQIIDYSFSRLYKHLDVLYVIKKLLEVDKLKKLLMDRDQIQLFEYFPKPTIREEDVFTQNQSNTFGHEYDILYQDNRTEIQKIQDAYKAYTNLKNHQQILHLLDPNLINLFELNVNVCDPLQKDNSKLNNILEQFKIGCLQDQNATAPKINDDITEFGNTSINNCNQTIFDKQNDKSYSPVINLNRISLNQQIELTVNDQGQQSISEREIPHERFEQYKYQEETKFTLNQVK